MACGTPKPPFYWSTGSPNAGVLRLILASSHVAKHTIMTGSLRGAQNCPYIPVSMCEDWHVPR
eukprot:5151269-Prymnesium_polylepis.1